MILVDTHVVIWIADRPEKLSAAARAVIDDARLHGKGLAISGITLFELAMAISRGRIMVRRSLDSFLHAVEANFIVKPITGRIAAQAVQFPESYPQDPMDRIIGATSIVDGLPLITADSAIRRCKVIDTIW
ncbi:MAG: type II toxin-antitoxin system VapC family toxin [Acidobacteriaceae bacterium]